MSTVFLHLTAVTAFLATASECLKIGDDKNKLFQKEPTVTNTDTELRCYCNLSECIVNGYMCKSSGAGCFSELEVSDTGLYVLKGIYGCLDLLPLNKSCDEILKTDVDPYHCCTQDMCNDNNAIMSLGTKKYFSLPSALKDESNVQTNNTRTVWQRRNTAMISNTEMEWFETMTLFVPICGAVALVLLVFIAIKLLKSNSSLDDGSLVSKIRPNKNYGFTILPNGRGSGPGGVHNTMKVSSNGYHKCVQSKMLPSDVYRPTTYVFAVPTTAEKNAAYANANHIDLAKHSLIAPVNCCHYEETLSAQSPPQYTPVDTNNKNNNDPTVAVPTACHNL
ncbi:uncharacterized protein LOC126899418 [Daktulosphaira vitifoliae]|uniref:uncharacterized protein LOC126899418 n=1 Tax=Daktulosphaira vitifoliae TaxID=58002 RepID=UPI0021A98225|nr:uncharacterized protein LOC126899418 [Daktulosphaira vitifoliae]